MPRSSNWATTVYTAIHTLAEDYARRLIAEEAMHISDSDNMLRRPGEVAQAIKNDAP